MTSLKDPRIRMTIPPLTPRQREVLGLLARGYTNPQIGEALGISLDGAKWHVAEIMTRLGVDSREQAAAYWRDYNRVPARLSRLARGLLPVAAWAKWGAAVAGVGAVSAVAVVTVVAMNSGSEGIAVGTGTSIATATIIESSATTPTASPSATSGTAQPGNTVAATPAADVPSKDVAIGTLEAQDYQSLASQLVTHAPSDGTRFVWFSMTSCNATSRQPIANAPTLLEGFIHGAVHLDREVDNADGTYEAIFHDNGDGAIILNGGRDGIASIARACNASSGATAPAPVDPAQSDVGPTGIPRVDAAIAALQYQFFTVLASQLATNERQCGVTPPPDGDWLSPCAAGVAPGTKQAVYLVGGCDGPHWMPASTAAADIAGMLSGAAHIYGVRQNPDSTYSAIFQDNNDSAFTLTISDTGITTVSRACGAPPSAVLRSGGTIVAGPFA